MSPTVSHLTRSLMGHIVMVTKTATFGYFHENTRRSMNEAEIEPRAGWVVGVRHRKIGVYIPESPACQRYECVDEGDPAYFRVEKVVPVLLVAFWPTMAPVDVPLDGYLASPNGQQPYPSAGYGSGVERRKNIEHVSKWVREHAPRNKQGRFVAEPRSGQ